MVRKMKNSSLLSRIIILLFLVVSIGETKQRCIQEECTEWWIISKPCGTTEVCVADNDGKEICENQTLYCKIKGPCKQRKCTKWEKILEKILPKEKPSGGFSGAIRG